MSETTAEPVATDYDSFLDAVPVADDDTADDTDVEGTDIESVDNTGESVDADTTEQKGYKPVFNNTVRTIVYVAGLIATVVGLGFLTFGSADIGGFISTAAGLVTSGFGVAYNPTRLANS